MRHIAAFITFLLSISSTATASPSGGKTSLSGTITDAVSHLPIAGASVSLPDLRLGTTTRTDGTYRIDDLPTTSLLIRVSMVGYSTVIRTIDLSNTTTLDIALEPSATELAETVVTGTSKATALRRDPVPTVLVPRDELQRSAATNAIETLNKVPGVSTWTTGPNVSKPVIHGLGSNRVLTLFDGVRIEGQQWGEEHGVEVDQFLIDRIEVVKGPASLLYGSDALAGVVNLLPVHPVAPGTISGEWTGAYATNNGQVAGSLALNGNTSRWVWGLRGSHKQASNYRNSSDGRVFNTKYDEDDVGGYFGVNRSWGYSHLTLGLYDNLQEIPDGSRDSLTRAFTKPLDDASAQTAVVGDDELRSYTIGAVHQHVQHYRANLANSVVLGNGRIAVNLGYQRSVRREFGYPQHPSIPGLFLTLNTTTYDVKYFLPEHMHWETTLGVNGMMQANTASEGTEFIIPDFTLRDIGPFLHVKHAFEKIDLAAGIRYDSRAFNSEAMYTQPDAGSGFDHVVPGSSDSSTVKRFDTHTRNFSGVSASAGIAFNMNERLTLKANIARGFRAPSAAEISAAGVHPGTGFAQFGSADLKPETSLQEDIGVFYSGTHVTGSAEVFLNTIDNYIYNEKLLGADGSDSIYLQDGEAFEVFEYRRSKARLIGGELTLDAHPHPLDWLHIEGSIALLSATNLGGGHASVSDSTRYLPQVPPMRFTVELRAMAKKGIGRLRSLYGEVGMQLVAAQDRVFSANGTETPTPGYALLEAGCGADLVDAHGSTVLSISVNATNLADVAYQSHMSRLKYMDDHPESATGASGIFEMGRNIALKITVPFTIKRPKEEVP